MQQRLLAPLALCAALSGLLPAQSRLEPVNGTIVEGAVPGTQRWIVHFTRRSFDLDAFAAAIRDQRPAAEVDAIVRRMEQQVIGDQAGFSDAVRKLGGTVVTQWWIINAAAIDIAPALLPRVEELPGVLRLQPDVWCEAAIQVSTNANNHNSDAVNATGEVGLNVTTAIMDTGQDENMGGVGRPHRSYFINGDITNLTGGGIGGSRLAVNRQIGSQPADDVHGHGTGVASVSAGADWGTAGADNGHAPRAKIAGYAISNNTGGSSSTVTMTAAWQSIAADRATFNIVSANNSYSGSPSPLDATQQALDSAARNADIMVCVAAANNGSSTGVSQSCANGLAVAAVNANTHTVATFSSRGPLSGDTARFYPDISACGVSTVMALRNNEGGDYTASGTSMASPQVCGAATLIRAAVPSLTALETKSVLLASARDISAQNPTAPYNSRNAYGMGLLRDDDAVALAQNPLRRGTATVSTRAMTWSVNFSATAGQLVQAAIAWHRNDTAITTWANLDLQVYRGATLVAQANSTRNLYEMVRFTASTTATYELRVVAVTFETGLASEQFSWAVNRDTAFSGVVSPAGFLATEGNAAFFNFGVDRRLMGIDQTNTGTVDTFQRIAWRRDGTTGASSSYSARTMDMAVRMGYANFAQLSSVLASNYASAATTVYSLKPTNFPDWSNPPVPTPAPFDMEVVFDVPFAYNGTRALIWDLDVAASSNTTIVPMDRQYVAATATAGSALGTGCLSTGQTTRFSHTLTLHNGGAAMNPAGMVLQFGGTFAPANAPGWLSIDAIDSNQALPILCAPLRANPTILLPVGNADGSGTFATTYLGVPYNPGIVGAPFVTQMFAVDFGQPSPFIPFSFSNGRQATMPAASTGSLAAAYIWAAPPLTSATLFLGGAPIALLR